jgi:putative transposase
MCVFDSDSDRAVYLDLLRERADRYRLLVWAWCLMGNHVHLLGVPQRTDSLHRALGRTHADYARYLNAKRRSCGHLWQACFYSCVVAPKYLWVTMAYIENNPVRAAIVTEAEQYRWSSAMSHVTAADNDHLLQMEEWRRKYTPERWKDVLNNTVDAEADSERIREATVRGRPLGDDVFSTHLESILGRRRLRPNPVGRPRKQVALAESQLATQQEL